jgi:CubicO group peptidase (beta-lactamase class C family)
MLAPIIVSQVRLTPDRLDGVYAALAEDVAAGRVPLAALAVGDDQGLVRKAVVGAQSVARRGRPRVDAESLFFLASVTKPIFATAVMQLVEEGALELDAPLGRWLPEFNAGDKRAVTVRHLLAHTSGVPDILPEVIRRTRPTAAQLTRLSIEAPLEFAPGTRWAYSSATFYVLAEVVRRITGQSARRFLRLRLLEPLGMFETRFDPRRRGRTLVPVQGIGADNPIKRFFLLRYVVALAHPGGGLWGTLDDIVRFASALLAPREDAERWLPISPQTFALMGEDHAGGVPGLVGEEERPVHHGLGWAKPTLNIPQLPGSARVVDHGGATGTRLWIDPEARLVFVYFTNQWNGERAPEYRALRGVYEALDQAAASGSAG